MLDEYTCVVLVHVHQLPKYTVKKRRSHKLWFLVLSVSAEGVEIFVTGQHDKGGQDCKLRK